MKPGIPIPCPANWDEMKIGQLSRHCTSCAKDVIDFTQQSRQQILAYLIEHRDQEVCGRVRTSQLDYRHEEILVIIRDLEKKHRNTNLSWYLLTMATLSMMSCESGQQKVQQKQEQAEILGAISLPGEVTDSEKSTPDQPVEKSHCKTSQVIEYSDVEFSSGLMEVPPPEIVEPPMPAVDPDPMIVGEFIAETGPRMIVEVMPEFKGGTDALMAYVKGHLKYPRWEKKNKVQGTVYATFVVNGNGKISGGRILRSVPEAKNFDQEVLKLIKNMPDWIPGSDKGAPAAVQFNMPFRFEL